MPNLVKKVQNTIFQYDLFKKNDKIILGVSGGPDSVCLLDIFFRLQKKYNLELIIAHVNYGLRGRDSKQDEKFVHKLAEKYKLKVIALSPVLSRLRKRRQFPSENELRDIRYAFFEKLRAKNKFDYIAVAHNADDQAETFLMRLIRGAGLLGLSAMRYKNNRIIRPLLNASRLEIFAHLKKNRLSYRVDKTNLKFLYMRNKIRNRLLPYLEKNFNPNIRQTIFDATVSVGEDYSFISDAVDRKCKKLKEMDVKKIQKFHPAIQRGLLRKLLAKHQNNLENISAAHIAEILKVVKSTKNKTQTVSLKRLKIIRKGDKLDVERITKL